MLPVGSNSYQFTSYSVSVAVVSYTASCSLLALTRSVICRNRRMRYKYRLIKVLILYYFASLARFGNVGARPGEDAVTGGARLGVPVGEVVIIAVYNIKMHMQHEAGHSYKECYKIYALNPMLR